MRAVLAPSPVSQREKLLASASARGVRLAVPLGAHLLRGSLARTLAQVLSILGLQQLWRDPFIDTSVGGAPAQPGADRLDETMSPPKHGREPLPQQSSVTSGFLGG
ncbi:hypothetical protein PR003_g12832 [Phytophthora rubi]|uniref:Uncharacterized protein n=1 Tax=Phytophthora rubi TaxID=129364 RepID=A0A6A4FJ65_9STRA|nr:hypothetical protein PR002_g17404 [Phytophthora rubi]KAE9335794.1 hypothetical protein PR003_g12832 [Phytophthora rubi]